jgi:hypothetical protein
MKTRILLALLLLLTCGMVAVGSAADSPASRLRSARSLRCAFTSSVSTWVKNGHRSIEQTNDKGSAVYDNINVAKGTARIVANWSGDIAVWLDAQGDLWMLERTPSGNEVITTVFPMYAEGTDEFVVLESRHSLAISGQTVLGETAFGTCAMLE